MKRYWGETYLRKIPDEIEQYRIRSGAYGSMPKYPCGFFQIPFRSYTLRALVSDGVVDGWEHVSVSLPNRCPNWEEMAFIKDCFWGEDECVVQYHPPKSEYVNNHPYCLHLWRSTQVKIPRPPTYMIGVNGKTIEDITVKDLLSVLNDQEDFLNA